MRILKRDSTSGHLDDVERMRLEKRALALIRETPTVTDSKLATLLAREAGRTREEVYCVVCSAFSAWYRQKAPTATQVRARMAS
jgi:hypothetical protein